MYTVSKMHPQIHYILGDMIPSIQGCSLFQDSSLNRTPKENCYMSSYKGPNEIYEDFIEREWNLISMVDVSDPEDETVTCGSMYNFAMLNNPETSHLVKTVKSPNL